MCDPDPDPDRDLSELLADIERIRRALDADPDSADLHARLAESLHELAFEPTWDDHRTPHLAGSGDRDPLLLAAMHLSRACGLRPGDGPVLVTGASAGILLRRLPSWIGSTSTTSRVPSPAGTRCTRRGVKSP